MLYRCLVKKGHFGSGRFIERSIFIRAASVTEAMRKAKNFRGVKKGHLRRSGASVLSIERADAEETEFPSRAA